MNESTDHIVIVHNITTIHGCSPKFTNLYYFTSTSSQTMCLFNVGFVMSSISECVLRPSIFTRFRHDEAASDFISSSSIGSMGNGSSWKSREVMSLSALSYRESEGLVFALLGVVGLLPWYFMGVSYTPIQELMGIPECL